MLADGDLHFALCIIKIFALLVIASALWTMSSRSRYGLATDRFGIAIEGNNVGSASYLGPGYAGSVSDQVGLSGGSQAPFGNRYEPPVFWNVGDLNSYESVQSTDSSAALAALKQQQAAAAAAQASGSGTFKGYASDLGVALRGYATNLPGIDGHLQPNY